MDGAISTEEMCARYRRLYTGAIYDVLSRRGLKDQVLNRAIKPVLPGMAVAGPAYTVKGMRVPADEAWRVDPPVDLLAGVTPGCVIVYDPGNEQECGHWGELTSNAAAVLGARGVVVDGGVRDLAYVESLGLPIMARYRTPAQAIGRWRVTGSQVPVRVRGALEDWVTVEPGDLVVADRDGVIVVPAPLVSTVAPRALQWADKDSRAREDIRRGGSLLKALDTYGHL